MRQTSFHPLKLNLSSNPFCNRKSFWTSWSILIVLVLIAQIYAWQQFYQEQNNIKNRQQRNELEQKKLESIKAQLTTQPLQLTSEQEKAIRSIVILSKKRSFSWSQLLTQLEIATPREIRIIKINPEKVSSQNLSKDIVPLSITVASQKPENITKFLSELGKHNIFHFEPKSQEKHQANNTGSNSNEITFLLNGFYNPNVPGLEVPITSTKENRPLIPPTQNTKVSKAKKIVK